MRKHAHQSIVPFSLILFLAGQIPVSCAQQTAGVPEKLLPRFHKVNETLYRGGMPKEEGFKLLKEMGIKTVVNFRNENDEEPFIKRLGMKYIHIPLTAKRGIDDLSIQEFFKVVNDPKSHPVFVHCQRGADRTGTMIAFYRIAFEDWDPERAYREAREMGLRWWHFKLKDQIRNFDPSPFSEIIRKK